MIKAGNPAPDFVLPDQDGQSVWLAALRGRWIVLYFYPRDDTPGCTVEACEFTTAMPAFRRLEAEVFGCSPDPASKHQKFIAKHRLGIRLLTDADRSVMKRYGAFGKKMMYGKQVEGVIRSTVLIAPDGSVAQHWPTVKAAGHAEEVRRALVALRSAGARAEEQPTRLTRRPASKTAEKVAKKTVKKVAKKTAAKKIAAMKTAKQAGKKKAKK